MRLPHRLKPLPSPEGESEKKRGRENKASFITLPSLLLQSLAPLEHYPFPVLFWCVNERIENLQAPKETLSMKMRQSESTRVHTAHHSSQPDSDQTPSTPSRLLEQDTNTHEITHNCTGACWLTSLCRHKHLHGGVKSLHRRGWGYSVKCVSRYGSWNISAASITSAIWKHAGGEIKSVLEHRGLAVLFSVLEFLKHLQREKRFACLSSFIQNCMFPNQQSRVDQLKVQLITPAVKFSKNERHYFETKLANCRTRVKKNDPQFEILGKNFFSWPRHQDRIDALIS